MLRSRVGRRLLGMFVACALLPTIALAVVGYTAVRGRLERESQRRLRDVSKAVGLQIHERLIVLEESLRPIAARLDGKGKLPPELVPHLRDRFEAMALADPQGATRSVFGGEVPQPEISSAAREHLAAGGTLVTTVPGDGSGRVAMVTGSGKQLLLAEVSPDYLFAVARDSVDLDGQGFCVLDENLAAVSCSSEDPLPLNDELAFAMTRRVSGEFVWPRREEDYRARYWALFLRPRFNTPRWVVVVAEAESRIFASLREFSASFGLIVAGSLLVVALLGMGQIRRSLIPLRRLREGALRLADQDFDTRVRVSSNDEFQDLAQTFNAMAAQLGVQFRSLEARSELDRAVLSSMDLGSIIDTVLERTPGLYPCDAVSVVVLDAPSSTSARSHLAEAQSRGRRQRDDVLVDLDAVRVLESGAELECDLVGPVADYLKPLTHRSMRSALVLPIRFGGQLLGVLALARREADTAWQDRALASQLVDQVAVAFSNAQMLERVRFLAYHDSLTKLPNRRRFTEDLAQALERARRRDTAVAVVFFDLDDFKRVNDTMGHGVGDELLRSVARRVRDHVGRSEGGGVEYELARLGGDEFTLLVPDVGSMEGATDVAERLLRTLVEPVRLGSHEVVVSGSVGIAMYPFDGDEAGTLMKNADTAMHAAKELGKNRFQFYTQSMNEAAVERVTLEGQLRKALSDRQFELYYQPIVELEDGRLAGAEALLRWNHPDLGLVTPDVFIRVAEEMGLIVPLGEWILEEACRTAMGWSRNGRGEVPMSVNLSGRQFREEKLVDCVARALTTSGLRPGLLSLEITETMLMRADGQNLETLRALRALGVRVAVDDFGTGYSSLAYLKNFPVDSLKIDRSFVRDVAVEQNDAAITRAIIAMGQTLQLRIVAEGVETHEQLAFLREHGCDAIQGFLIGRPTTAECFAESFLDGTLL
jgi:diguanylate cyclase (GGDEF)-like protein